jgi:acyl dehydratase
MKVFTSIEQLERAAGTHLGHSAWHRITQQQIDAFAEITGDLQWIHVDPAKATRGPFGTTIAHGFLTLSLVSAFIAEVYRVEGLQMGINYGADRVRFPAPVPVDTNIRAGVEISSVTLRPAGHQVVTRVTVEAEGGDKPVCVVDAVTLYVP